MASDTRERKTWIDKGSMGDYHCDPEYRGQVINATERDCMKQGVSVYRGVNSVDNVLERKRVLAKSGWSTI